MLRTDQEEYNEYLGFNDAVARNRFIRKTYTIVTFQVLLTFGIMIFIKFNYELEAMKFFIAHFYLVWVAFAGTTIISLSFACFPAFGRTTPINYIGLILFTFLFTFLMVGVSLKYEPQLIVICMGITGAITLTVTFLACVSKIDVTNCWVLVLLLSILGFGLSITALFIHDRTYRIVYCAISLAIVIFFLFFDTQLMIGGNHRNAYSTEDHIIAAICLYSDILAIFSFLIGLISETTE